MSEKIIWDYLMTKIGNPYGVAGLMGNLYVESKLSPTYLQSSYAKKLGMSSAEYTKRVDNKTYLNFVNDSAGYGLVQWTYWSRKEALYNYAKQQGKSIGDLNMQLNFIWKEIQSYKTVLNAIKTATSIRAASDVVCTRYEKPANQSEKGKQTRADYGQKYFDMFHQNSSTVLEKNDQKPASTHSVVTTANVNIRAGNGKEFPILCTVKKDTVFTWVATSENKWYAVKLPKHVGWVTSEFATLK